MRSLAARNLLLGMLALQNSLINRQALVAAFDAWVHDKSRELGQILLESGAIQPAQLELLEALVVEHLRMHGGDAEQSLAAVSSVGSARQELDQIDDPDLQASLLHLSAAAETGSDLFRTTPPSAGTSTSAGLRFRILRPHARGGLGEVFVAHDSELHREVALKEIQDKYADHSAYRGRFLLEAEITGGLEHPGIVPVYGLGTYADGRPFYAMRFIRGNSLKDAIEDFHHQEARRRQPLLETQERSLTFRNLLRRLIDVCNAIAYAHSRGVLHRDLKPGNIMLGKYGETLVVDWGLAKATELHDSQSRNIEQPLRPSDSGSEPTAMGAAIGTLEYMSPEQAAGRLDLLGPASDVYSLGATLYCLLTGQTPFRRDDEAVMQRIAKGDFPPPHQIQRDVPRPLEAICLMAMANQGEDRYASPRKLADELERWLADERVVAYPEPLVARVRRWGKRHLLAVSSTGVLLLTAVIALGVGLWFVKQEQLRTEQQRVAAERAQRQATQAANDARAAQTRAEEHSRRARRLSELTLKTLHSVVFDIQHKLRDVPAAQAIRRSLLDTAIAGLREVGTELDLSEVPEMDLAVAHVELGDVLREAGSESGQSATLMALEQYERGHSIFQTLARSYPKDDQVRRRLSVSYSRLGEVSQQLGHLPAAKLYYAQYLAIAQKLSQENAASSQAQRDVPLAFSLLGDASQQSGDLPAAKRYYEQSLEIMQRFAQADPGNAKAQRDLSALLQRMGDVNRPLGHLAIAKRYYEESLEIIQKLAQADPADAQEGLSLAFGRLGDVSQGLGDLRAAMQYHERSLEITQKLAQADPSKMQVQRDLLVSFSRIGEISQQLGDLPAAKQRYEAYLEGMQNLARQDPANVQGQRDLSIALGVLGDFTLQLGDPSTARRHYEQSLDIRQTLAQADPENAQAQCDLSVSFRRLGDVTRKLNRVAAAKGHYVQSLEIVRKLTQAEPTNAEVQRHLSVSLSKLGDVSRTLQDLPAAKQYYQQCLEIMQKLVDADPANVQAQRDLLLSLGRLGNVNQNSGDLPTAKTYYEQELEICQKLAQMEPASVPAQKHLSLSFEKLARLNRKLGDLVAAKTYYQRRLEIRQLLAQVDPSNVKSQRDLWTALTDRGEISRELGDLPGARLFYDQALEIRQQEAQADPANTTAQRNLYALLGYLGNMCQVSGDLSAARKYYEQRLAIDQRLTEKDSSNFQSLVGFSYSLGKLAGIDAAASDHVAAIQKYRQSIEILQQLIDNDKVANQSNLRKRLEEHRAALVECERVLTSREPSESKAQTDAHQ